MADSLTNAQREDLKHVFDGFDTDKSGKISHKELGNVFKELNIKANENQLKILIQDMDTNEDGEIEFEEFCRVMAKTLLKEHSQDELRAVFGQFDQNNSGFIEANELENMMRKMSRPCTKAQIDALLKSLDTSGDGKISFEEFLQFFN